MTNKLGRLAPDLKEAAMDFLRLTASGSVREAYGRYVRSGFRHHNPFFHGDAESLMVAMEENAAANPETNLEVQRALREGDLVAVHSWIRQSPQDPGASVVHIFRFQGDLIAEAWDVSQPVPEDSPNEHGLF
ncbi:MAG: nuclear transport factor 2 family protein [Nitrospiraceae bacterium]